MIRIFRLDITWGSNVASKVNLLRTTSVLNLKATFVLWQKNRQRPVIARMSETKVFSLPFTFNRKEAVDVLLCQLDEIPFRPDHV